MRMPRRWKKTAGSISSWSIPSRPVRLFNEAIDDFQQRRGIFRGVFFALRVAGCFILLIVIASPRDEGAAIQLDCFVAPLLAMSCGECWTGDRNERPYPFASA